MTHQDELKLVVAEMQQLGFAPPAAPFEYELSEEDDPMRTEYMRRSIEHFRTTEFYTVEIRSKRNDNSIDAGLNRYFGKILLANEFVSFSGNETGTSWIKHSGLGLDLSFMNNIQRVATAHRAFIKLIVFRSHYLSAAAFDQLQHDDGKEEQEEQQQIGEER